jgi:predicted CXXCH cytochrome family protein
MKFVKISSFLIVMIFVVASIAISQTYSGASCSSGCHSNSVSGVTQYTEWMLTKHARAYDSVAVVKNTTECAPCHTTGWDTTVANQGADDFVTRNGDGSFTITNTSSFNARKNVQCENCHGPVQLGVNHGFPSPTPGSLVHSEAEICGSCHVGDHQPEYPEWLTSYHAISDTNASPYLANLFRNDANCSACHTYQGFLQVIDSTSWVPQVPNPPGATALPIVCATCHDPHSNANVSQLRLPKADLCVKCHNPQYDPSQPVPGTEVHNTSSYMLEAKGGYEYSDYTYQSSIHKYTITDKCVTCHMHSSDYVSAEQPAITGHEFGPSGKACVTCHSDFDTLALTYDYRRVQTVTDSLSNLLSSKLGNASPADSATDAFKRAKFNYDFVEADMSHGVHNTKYAQGLLESALLNFSPSTSVENIDHNIPNRFTLNQNYPNPFNPTTSISFALASKEHVQLQIYDIAGNLISTLVDKDMSTGTYRVVWNCMNNSGVKVTTGVYIYKITAGSYTESKKMILMK